MAEWVKGDWDVFTSKAVVSEASRLLEKKKVLAFKDLMENLVLEGIWKSFLALPASGLRCCH